MNLHKLYLLAFLGVFLWIGCVGHSEKKEESTHLAQLELRLKKLELRMDSMYKPGFGEFMLLIQSHHSKLWFAGNAKNWPLAMYELDELKETLEDLRMNCKDRKETPQLTVLSVPLDRLKNAIEHQSTENFSQGVELLTQSCNSCHQSNQKAFNVITIPMVPSVGNQNFKP